MINHILGYHFNNPFLLKEALTHPSLSIVTAKHNTSINNYERLEFLGDSVLNLVIAELLMKQFYEEDEGKLAKRRSSLVAGDFLAILSHQIGLGSMIEMTEAEAKLGGRENNHNLENVLEAIIGAIYLDSNLEQVKQVIHRLWQPFIDSMPEVPTDPKSKLQEILQKNGHPLPKYELVESAGPGHMPIFKIRLKIDRFEEVIGEGKSKQQAEKQAAKLLLAQIERK